MATYVAQSDSYAGWSTGRTFGYFGLAAGAVALAGWAAMHGHVHGFMPSNLSDQLLVVAMTWIGGGVFAIMSLAVYGSILLSGRSRGTVTIDEKGVLRQIGKRSRMLAWDEIEGFVPSSSGLTLVSRESNVRIVIPRSLDDFRGCLAELKARNLQPLPPSRLRVKSSWWQQIRIFGSTYAFLLSYNPRSSHPVRIASLCLWMALFLWMLIGDEQPEDQGWFRSLGLIPMIGMLAWAIHHISHTW